MPYSVRLGSDASPEGTASSKPDRANPAKRSFATIQLNPYIVLGIALAIIVVGAGVWWLTSGQSERGPETTLVFPGGATGPPIPGPPGQTSGSTVVNGPGSMGPNGPVIPGPRGPTPLSGGGPSIPGRPGAR